MTREIKFRGKRYGDGDWVYGNLYQGTTDGKQYSIILNDAGYHLAPQDDRNLAIAFAENEVNVVSTQTIGQFTGLLDKNGKEIYEGDIVIFDNHLQGISQVVYDYAGFDVDSKTYRTALRPAMSNHMRVVGNIHDNPELLKTETL